MGATSGSDAHSSRKRSKSSGSSHRSRRRRSHGRRSPSYHSSQGSGSIIGHRRRSSREYSRSSEKSSSSGHRYHHRSKERRTNTTTRDERRKGRTGRDHPAPSRCIGVFGLNPLTNEATIRELFERFGKIERVQMVYDTQTGRSRGFCFLYFKSLNDARDAKNSCSGIEVDSRRIRVDFSITKRPHTPTPGIYMGRNLHSPRSQRYSHACRHHCNCHSCDSKSSRSRRYERSPRRHRTRSRSRSDSPRSVSPKRYDNYSRYYTC